MCWYIESTTFMRFKVKHATFQLAFCDMATTIKNNVTANPRCASHSVHFSETKEVISDRAYLSDIDDVSSSDEGYISEGTRHIQSLLNLARTQRPRDITMVSWIKLNKIIRKDSKSLSTPGTTNFEFGLFMCPYVRNVSYAFLTEHKLFGVSDFKMFLESDFSRIPKNLNHIKPIKTSKKPIKDLKNLKNINFVSKSRQLDRMKNIERSINNLYIDDIAEEQMLDFPDFNGAVSSLKDAGSEISSFMASLSSIITPDVVMQLKGTIGDISSLTSIINNDRVADAARSFVRVPAKLAEVHEAFAEAASVGADFVSKASLVVAVSSLLHYAATKASTTKWIAVAALVLFVVTSGFAKESLMWVTSCWSQLTKKEPDMPVEQMGVDTLKSIAAAGVALLCTYIGYSSKTFNVAKEFYNFIDKREKLNKSLYEVISNVILFFEHLCNSISKTAGMSNITFISTSMTEIDTFVENVEKFKVDVENGKVHFSRVCYDRLIALYNEGLKLEKTIPKNEHGKDIASLLRFRMNWLERKRKDFADSSFATDGGRVEPVGILIKGKPGHGKSMLLKYLHHALCARTLPPEMIGEFDADPDKFLYERQMETEYWDRYDDYKWVTLFDDLGQIRDQVGNADGEWMNIIRSINPQPYILHMADMADKGKTYFRSQFVIATTNLQKLEPQSIISPEAVLRRFKFKIDLEPDDQYTKEVPGEPGKEPKRVFESDKMPVGVNGERVFTEDVPVLYLNNGDNTRTRISFDELVDMCVKQHIKNKRQYENMSAEYKRIRDKNKLSNELLKEYSKDVNVDKLFSQPVATEQSEDIQASPHISGAKVMDTVQRYLNNNVCVDTNREYFMYTIVDALKSFYPFIVERVALLTEYVIAEGNGDMRDPIILALNLWYDFCKKNDYNPDQLYKASEEDFAEDIGAFYDAEHIFPTLSVGVWRKFNWANIKATFISLFNTWIKDPAVRLWKWLKDITSKMDIIHFAVGLAAIAITKYIVSPPLVVQQQQISTSNDYSSLEFFFKEPQYQADVECAVEQSFEPGDKMKAALPKQQSFEPGDKMKSVQQVTPHSRGMAFRSFYAKPQMGVRYDNATYCTALSVVKDNCFAFQVETEPGLFKTLGYATFLAGYDFLVPYHFVSKSFEAMVCNKELATCHVTLTRRSDDLAISFTLEQLFKLHIAVSEESDLALIRLSSKIAKSFKAKDIRKHIITQDAIDRYFTIAPCIMLPLPEKVIESNTGQARIVKDYPVLTSSNKIRHINAAWHYPGPFTVGDCGRPCFVMHNNSHWGSLAGIHVAGIKKSGIQANMGISTMVTDFIISQLYEHLEDDDNQPAEEQAYFPSLKDTIPERFNIIEVVDKPVRYPIKSSIGPSLLAGAWSPIYTHPARLRGYMNHDGEWIDPYLIALDKYCKNDAELPMQDLKEIAVAYGQWLEHVSPHNSAQGRPFTVEEAVKGLEGHQYFTALTRSTSAGYPYIHDPLFKGKGSFPIFGEGDEYDLSTPAFAKVLEDINFMISEAKAGRRVTKYFTDNLKDQRVELQKWLKGKGRLFSGASKDVLIRDRMYFGPFTEWFSMNHTFNGSAIGVNPYSSDWDVIAKKLQEKGGDRQAYGAGDYSGFDGSERSEIHWLILDIINEWFLRRGDTQENCDLRKIFWLDLVNSIHIRWNVVYEWKSSLPSGHFLTAPVNTMYNAISMRYGWLRMEREEDPNISVTIAMRNCHANCYYIMLGDDNLFGVTTEYQSRYTEANLSRWLSDLGLKYTSELKNSVNETMRHLTDVEFLKRSFRWDDILARYVAPLRLSVVLEIPYWTKEKSGEKDQIVLSNLQTSLDELSLHGSTVFSRYNILMVAALRKHYDKVPERFQYISCRDFIVNAELAWL